MNMGAQRADAAETELTEASEIETEAASTLDWMGEAPATEEPESPKPNRALPILLALLAVTWVSASIWSIMVAAPQPSLADAVQWTALVSGPLILIGILWLIFGQTPRRETNRFTRAVAAMRGESQALEATLASVALRLEDNHTRLTTEAAKLMTLGEEASDRLGRVTHYLGKESVTLDRKAEALEAAAANAKVDIGVLLLDLPRAEEQARAVAEAMKEAGLTAHGQAGALEGQLSALVARGREADEVVGGAAQRLGANLARIESNAAAATERLDEAAVGMAATVDGAMNRAAEAVDAARAGLEAQGSAMLAMIEQSRSAFDRAGEDAAAGLGRRLDMIGEKIQALAGHLAAQDAASQAMVSGLSNELDSLEAKVIQLNEAGAQGAALLNSSFEAVRACAQHLFVELGSGHERAGTLIDRAHEMAAALAIVSDQLDERLPAALSGVEQQAGRTREAATALIPDVEAIETAANNAAARLSDAGASLGKLSEGAEQADARIKAIGDSAAEADRAAAKLTGETGPALIDALMRVREAATQAAERAREAIADAIPESAALLGEASRKAVSEAVTAPVHAQLGALEEASERAVSTARDASERLTRQLLVIGESAAAVEAKIDEERRAQQERDGDMLSRRVALLVESLNSTAIDVAKVLSNDVTDSAWSAYLRGDRGIFTRRAVRLLDNREAREIARHYEEEPEFREQVNRYIADFEAMLRRVLADKDGNALAVTIISSDMGKLYVALAQGIERLRN